MIVLLLFVSSSRAAPAPGRVAVSNRDAVHAAFTVNLARFITWPEGALGPAGAPFLIGTFPGDPINAELDAIVRGEEIAGRRVQTVRLRSATDALKCHVVFISREAGSPDPILALLVRRPVLTISDADEFLEKGGHVHLLKGPRHTRLQISAVNLRVSGLEARAQLLRLAELP